MNAKTHSRGPWPVALKTDDCFPHVVIGGICLLIPTDNDADASLVGAAPDLLEALREIDGCYCEVGAMLSADDRLRHRLTLIKARAAIAKATGGVS